MRALLLELLQLALTVAVAPLVTGLVRWIKARLNARRGPSPIQPYRDLFRLLRKEVVLAENASWLFRVSPYLIFTAVWLAAAIVPTFATGLLLAPTADLIALVALLGSARFVTALAGMDVGTSFGGIGSSREMMIASLAEFGASASGVVCSIRCIPRRIVPPGPARHLLPLSLEGVVRPPCRASRASHTTPRTCSIPVC